MTNSGETISTSTDVLTIAGAARALRTHSISVRDLWDSTLKAAKKENEKLNAYIDFFDEDTSAIITAQKRIDEGSATLLTGIPLAIKDNILIEGNNVSAASKILENYKAPYTATVIEKLQDAGALFLGRTNMDEFAMGSSTETSIYGVTKNPNDLTRVPGGSSGGSAAAVAAHMAVAALGSDTGGSIRQPASYCGVVGLKPTYGAVSRYGLIAMGSSLDQIGPLTKTVEDAQILFDMISGHDKYDATSLHENIYPKHSTPETFRIGVPWALLEKGVSKDVRALFDAKIQECKDTGCEIVDVELPSSGYALPVYYVVMPAEASTNLSRIDGMRYGLSLQGESLLEDYVRSRTEGFGDEVKRRILLGTFVLSSGYIDAYYRKAHAARSILTKEYNNAFEKVDVIAVPTAPSPAFVFGEKNNPVSMYAEDIFTVTANLTGMPALSVPMGTVKRDDRELPVGMQFTAPHQAEEILFTMGKLFEKAVQGK